jgi:hypothetical protein
MAFYLVTRTDDLDYNQYDGMIVRASGRKQALALVTRGPGDIPFAGFAKDGSNARVEKLEDGREHKNAVLLASFIGS